MIRSAWLSFVPQHGLSFVPRHWLSFVPQHYTIYFAATSSPKSPHHFHYIRLKAFTSIKYFLQAHDHSIYKSNHRIKSHRMSDQNEQLPKSLDFDRPGLSVDTGLQDPSHRSEFNTLLDAMEESDRLRTLLDAMEESDRLLSNRGSSLERESETPSSVISQFSSSTSGEPLLGLDWPYQDPNSSSPPESSLPPQAQGSHTSDEFRVWLTSDPIDPRIIEAYNGVLAPQLAQEEHRSTQVSPRAPSSLAPQLDHGSSEEPRSTQVSSRAPSLAPQLDHGSSEEPRSTQVSPRAPSSATQRTNRGASSSASRRREANRPAPYSTDSSPSSGQAGLHSEAAGLDRTTGLLTLVGTYPPVMRGNVFTCPHPDCRLTSQSWTTQNGYKYHLNESCPQNPLSKKSLRLANGEPVRNANTDGVTFTCEDCGGVFRSGNGFRLHRTKNEGTKDGRCADRIRGRQTTTHAGQTEGSRQINYGDYLNQD